MSNWKVGDVVKLKSGGPRMTVTMDRKEFGVDCMWFDGQKNMTATFPVDAIEEVESNPPQHHHVEVNRGPWG